MIVSVSRESVSCTLVVLKTDSDAGQNGMGES